MTPAQTRYTYQANALMRRFEGLSEIEEVTQSIIDRWRKNPWKLSPVYIENCVKAVEILTGRKFAGKKLIAQQKRPDLVSLGDLDKLYATAKAKRNRWFCTFLRFAYVTGLRLMDLTKLHRSCIKPDCIELRAAKTGKLHVIPRHLILMGDLPDGEFPLYHRPITVRKKFARYCKAAGIPYFTPKAIRKTAITQYELARPGAGAVLQGSAISGSNAVTWRHYIDHETILRQAQDNLQIPPSMLPPGLQKQKDRDESSLMDRFRRMKEDERQAVLKIVAAMG